MRRPADTSADARRRQLDAYRAMTPEARLRLADELSEVVRSLARAGIRARSTTDAGVAEVEAELTRLLARPASANAGRALRRPDTP